MKLRIVQSYMVEQYIQDDLAWTFNKVYDW